MRFLVSSATAALIISLLLLTASITASSSSSAAASPRIVRSPTSSHPPVLHIKRVFARIFGGMRRREQHLGDVWVSAKDSGGKTAARAFASGEMRSVDLKDDCSSSKKIRVCFRNATPEPLTLCWMNHKCEPHHFYKLEPRKRDAGSEDEAENKVGQREEQVDMIVNKEPGDHIETTELGHAFILARRTDGHEKNDEKMDESSVSSSRYTDLLPPPSRKSPLDCLPFCGRPWSLRGSNKVVKNPDGRCLIQDEVVGGYRPMAVGMKKDEDPDLLHSIHLITITRRRRAMGPFRIFWRDSDGYARGWEYSIQVSEGTLDKTPLDTSNKIYRCMQLGGWPIRCEEGLWEGKVYRKKGSEKEMKRIKEEEELKDMIAEDLAAAAKCLPRAACEALRKDTPIWINRSQHFGPACAPISGRGMCFHPDRNWLIDNGMSPEKEKCVEMYQVSEYAKDRDLWGEGGVLLHELSHAYHNKLVEDGYDNKDVRHCYESAMKKGLYDKVRVHGMKGIDERRAYACTNEMEYFAELSVAFLGGLDDEKEHNKWYPFNRKQLREHDPDAYQMLQRIWKVHLDD